MDYVSEEIVTEILRRLPVKSLVRFTGVCRLWKSIITSPQFKLEVSKRPAILLAHADQDCYLALVEDDEDDENLVRFETTDFPFKHLLPKAKLVGNDNGLVCFCISTPNYGGTPGTFIIWNPSVRKHAVIPMNPVGGADLFYADGFGATISRSDYKYVRIVPFVSHPQLNGNIRKLAVEIYSWKIGTWRRIYLDMDLYRCKQILPDCVSLRGRLHWMAVDESSFNINFIHSFELEDEVFEDIMLPECVSSSRFCAYRVNVYVIKESLAVIVDEEERPNSKMHCSVWVMQEYGDVNSWTKLCRLDLTTMVDVDWALHVKEYDFRRIRSAMVHLLKNGELLLGFKVLAGFDTVYPPKLVKYNPMTMKGTDVIRGVSSSFILRGFTNHYKESLVFLNHDHRKCLQTTRFCHGPPVLEACEARANTNIT